MGGRATPGRSSKRRAAPQATRGDGLADRLAAEITSGAISPGTRLDEESLATRYGMSRTPVREALRQLEATGLIERRPYRGAIVSAPTSNELGEMFAAMTELETSCAEAAAHSMSEEERVQLRAAHEKMGSVAAAGDVATYLRANRDWHELIYAGSHNRYLEAFAKDIRKRLMPYRSAQFRVPNRLTASFAEHAEILSAIEQANAAAAAESMRMHLRNVEAAYELVPIAG